MSEDEFLEQLRRELKGLPADEVEDIVSDYQSYFEEARAAGRTTDDVMAAHGDPYKLAQELRAELGLFRWEQHRTPVNLWRAVLALSGLIAVDLVILAPALLMIGLGILGLFFVMSLLGVIGIGTLLDVFSSSFDPAEGSAVYLVLRSIGFLIACFGGAVVLLFALRKAVTHLARYARLHYQLLRPKAHGNASPFSEKPKRIG